MIKQTQKTKSPQKTSRVESKPEQLWKDHVYRPSTEYTGPQAPKLNRSVNVDHFELPQNYNQTRMTLLARDPHWLHAYWEVTPDAINNLRQQLGQVFDNARYTLRMHDVTKVAAFNGKNANHSFDIEVAPQARDWKRSMGTYKG